MEPVEVILVEEARESFSVMRVRKKINGFDSDTTNNRMELTAVIEGLSALKRNCDIKLFTDSKYVSQGINEWIDNWKQNSWKTAAKKPLMNVDLWKLLDKAVNQHRIEWRRVKGYFYIQGNEIADQLANQANDQALEKS